MLYVGEKFCYSFMELPGMCKRVYVLSAGAHSAVSLQSVEDGMRAETRVGTNLGRDSE